MTAAPGPQIAALIDELEPDVFLMQEVKSFEAGGDALPHALEADQNARVPCREEIIGQARREASARNNGRRCPVDQAIVIA